MICSSDQLVDVEENSHQYLRIANATLAGLKALYTPVLRFSKAREDRDTEDGRYCRIKVRQRRQSWRSQRRTCAQGKTIQGEVHSAPWTHKNKRGRKSRARGKQAERGSLSSCAV